MERIFKDFRKNKNVSRKGVEALVREIKSHVNLFGTLTFTPMGETKIMEDWEIFVKNDGKFNFYSPLKKTERIRATILNLLTDFQVVGFILVCLTDQKIERSGAFIREMWGYRIINSGKTTDLEHVPHEELYEYCTTDFSSGKLIPPSEEVVYCGADGKICGWDLL